MGSIYFLTPTFRPVGGVIKVFDYARHALDLGYQPVVCCPEPFDSALPLFQIDRFTPLPPGRGVRYIRGFTFGIERTDLAFFSWPDHMEHIAPRLAPGTSLHQVIHLVQNTRHANPHWLGGYATRLLTRPMARIMVTQETLDACRPYLNESSPTRVIVEGHDWPYFHRDRGGEVGCPLQVGYTTWKSGVGVELEQALVADERFAFRSIRDVASWAELRELYQWADVILGTPGPEEGFYLVGLEAMAAGALLVTADAGGNRAYSRFGGNCLQAEFESASSYRQALEQVLAMTPTQIAEMRSAAYAVLENHTLERERTEFGDFVRSLAGFTPAPRSPSVAGSDSAATADRPALLDLTPDQRAHVPTFVGIGAQKAGTTWLHRNLQRHPQVCFAEVSEGFGLTAGKEVHFLDRDDYFQRGPAWYLGLFAGCTQPIRGEITPDYMMVDQSRVELMHSLNPDLRLILLLRNPVDRAWSAMRYYLANRGADPSSVAGQRLRSLAASPLVVRRSQYARALELWEGVFSPQQMLVGFFEEVAQDPEGLLRRVLRHIGADADIDLSSYPLGKRFNPGKEADMPPGLRAFLRELFAEEIAAMAKRFGPPASNW
jgi:hypothetical protein